jgi:hypothetical protein
MKITVRRLTGVQLADGRIASNTPISKPRQMSIEALLKVLSQGLDPAGMPSIAQLREAVRSLNNDVLIVQVTDALQPDKFHRWIANPISFKFAGTIEVEEPPATSEPGDLSLSPSTRH